MMIDKRNFQKVFIMVLACILFVGCGGKSDLDKMIGTWHVDNLEDSVEYSFQDFTIEFYEANEKDGTIGNFNYTNDSGSERKGEYNYHQSSKTLEMSFYDEFGVQNDWTIYISFQVKFVGNGEIEMKGEEASIKLIQVND